MNYGGLSYNLVKGVKFNIHVHVHVQWGLRGEGYRTLYMHEICAIPACTLTAFCFTSLVHRRGGRGGNWW